jgi:hypothetical protein
MLQEDFCYHQLAFAIERQNRASSFNLHFYDLFIVHMLSSLAMFIELKYCSLDIK